LSFLHDLPPHSSSRTQSPALSISCAKVRFLLFHRLSLRQLGPPFPEALPPRFPLNLTQSPVPQGNHAFTLPPFPPLTATWRVPLFLPLTAHGLSGLVFFSLLRPPPLDDQCGGFFALRRFSFPSSGPHFPCTPDDSSLVCLGLVLRQRDLSFLLFFTIPCRSPFSPSLPQTERDMILCFPKVIALHPRPRPPDPRAGPKTHFLRSFVTTSATILLLGRFDRPLWRVKVVFPPIPDTPRRCPWQGVFLMIQPLIFKIPRANTMSLWAAR